MKLRTKFILASLVVLALLAVLVNGSLLLLVRAKDEVAAGHRKATGLVRKLYNIRGHELTLNDEVNDLIRHGFKTTDLDQYRTATERYVQELAELEALMPASPELELLRTGRNIAIELSKQIDTLISTNAPDISSAELALSTTLGEMADVLDAWGEDVEAHMLGLIGDAERQESLAIERVERIEGFIRLLALAIIGMIILVIAGQFRLILHPLIVAIEKLVKGATEIGKGNLEYRLDIRTRDEIERLSQAFNHMAGNLGSSYRSLEVTSQALQNELEKGRQLQQDFLPYSLPQPSGWELAALLKPARVVSGDFYDAFELPGGVVAIVIGDVCDKGVGSALFMALCRSLLRIFSSHDHSNGLTGQPDAQSDILRRLGDQQLTSNADVPNLLYTVAFTNSYIAQTHSHTSMFTTLFYGVLDPATGVLSYINGGHEPPVILGPEGIKVRLTTTGPAVGLFPDVGFEVEQIQFEVGDMLIAYTDGVVDARDPNGQRFTEARLLALFEKPITSAATLLDSIEERLKGYMAEAVQFDDITLLAVRRARVSEVAKPIHELT